jgi:glycosyltransferase involved in cell wall biosynthesis
VHRILVSAYGCEPNKGSEQGVGWHWVLEMAKTDELWVITRSNNQQGIEAELPTNLFGRINFIYYDLPEVLKKFKHKEKRLYLYCFLWQLGAYKLAKQVAREMTFDYCIHLSFGSMWMPTFMYKIPIPFIWGPIGGGESVPNSYIKTLPWKSRILQYARQMLILTARFNPLFTKPARAAKAIIARTEDSKVVFPQKIQQKVRVMLETGMYSEVLEQYNYAEREISSPYVEIIFTGRLVALKNVEMAIRSLAALNRIGQNIRLTILGDGPLKASLTTLAKELNVQNRIHFTGYVTQQEAIRALKQSDIFLFPSLKEGGTWSLIEAMAVGLPIICLDTTGMHLITDDSCAIRVPPTNPEETIKKMAEAISMLAKDADLRRVMGGNARKRIKDHFLWQCKGAFMVGLLKELDEQRPNRSKP